MTKWTKEEDDILRLHYPTATVDDLLDMLPGRNVSTISYRTRILRVKKTSVPSRWTDEEDKAVRDMYPSASMQEIEDALPGRSTLSIYQRAFKLRVSRIKHNQPTKECPDCGDAIQPRSARCMKCAKIKRAAHTKQYTCPDCGAQRSPASTRCRKCHLIHRYPGGASRYSREATKPPTKIALSPWEKCVLNELGPDVPMSELEMLLPRRNRNEIRRMASRFDVELLEDDQ